MNVWEFLKKIRNACPITNFALRAREACPPALIQVFKRSFRGVDELTDEIFVDLGGERGVEVGGVEISAKSKNSYTMDLIRAWTRFPAAAVSDC